MERYSKIATNSKDSVSDFYNWSRDYWIQKSISSEGQESNLLSFGFWRESETDFYSAQIALHELCLSHFPPFNKEDRGLEIGCGIGGNSIRIARRHDISMTGLDLSPNQIECASKNATIAECTNVDFVEGSSMSMPFEDDSFDFSICIESSFHYESIDAFAHENHRVLKPGSLALVADITCTNNSLINFKHGNYFRSIDTIENSFQKAGFQTLKIQRIGSHVFRALYAYISSIKERSLLHKYWTSVLRNYAVLHDDGVMGYDILVARKL